ncbi:hypothetical protein EDB19DRAFT_1826328 [Suillus lakei]|nr:hypothetical protein EDB19DRAFT_1826328 [Suillus lakei]
MTVNGARKTYLSDWITAFNEKGVWQGTSLNREDIREDNDPLDLSAVEFAMIYVRGAGHPSLVLDWMPYPTIDNRKFDTVFVSGAVGVQKCSNAGRNGVRSSARSAVRYWYFIAGME